MSPAEFLRHDPAVGKGLAVGYRYEAFSREAAVSTGFQLFILAFHILASY